MIVLKLLYFLYFLFFCWFVSLLYRLMGFSNNIIICKGKIIYCSFNFIQLMVCLPMSSTISTAAYGLPAVMAAFDNWVNFVESCNHSETVAAICDGSFWNSPKFDSKTTSTLPASWPGKKLQKRRQQEGKKKMNERMSY